MIMFGYFYKCYRHFLFSTSKLYPKVPIISNFLLEIILDVENRNIFTALKR